MSKLGKLIPFPALRREFQMAGATKQQAKFASRHPAFSDTLPLAVMERFEEMLEEQYRDLSPQEMKAQGDRDRRFDEVDRKEGVWHKSHQRHSSRRSKR